MPSWIYNPWFNSLATLFICLALAACGGEPSPGSEEWLEDLLEQEAKDATRQAVEWEATSEASVEATSQAEKRTKEVPPAPGWHVVEYRAESGWDRARGEITYDYAELDGAEVVLKTEQMGVSLPWEWTGQLPTGFRLVLRVRNLASQGWIKCSVLVDGVLVEELSAPGGYGNDAIVWCIVTIAE